MFDLNATMHLEVNTILNKWKENNSRSCRFVLHFEAMWIMEVLKSQRKKFHFIIFIVLYVFNVEITEKA